MAPLNKFLQNTKNNDNQNKRVRIVVMGPGMVGKSSIISRFLNNTYNDNYVETIEEFYAKHNYNMRNNTTVDLEILDTSGTYSFPAMRRLAVSSADVVMLVFSVENAETFEICAEIRQEIMLQREDLPIVFVANKVDSDQKSCALGKTINELSVTIEWNNSYVEVSAKTDVNIEAAFQLACAQTNTQTKSR